MPAAHFTPPPFHPARPGLVAPVHVDPSGRAGPTPGQARGPFWRTTPGGLRVPSSVDRGVHQRILEAAVHVRPGFGAVTGWAALCWCRARWFDGSTADDPAGLLVDLASSRTLRAVGGLRVCRERWDPREAILVNGVWVTIPVRSVCFAMRYASDVRRAAVAAAMAAYDDLVSADEVRHYLGHAPRHGLTSWTGVPQGRDTLPLLEENCWSPYEVLVMLVWMLDAGLPRPLMNHPVFDLAGRFVGTPDLIDVESGLIVQFDGVTHLERYQRALDQLKEEAYRDLGLEVLTLMSGEARTETARRMLTARRRARWLPEDQRRWTVEPPSWWTPTTTVEQRRALTPEQRERFLRYRIAA